MIIIKYAFKTQIYSKVVIKYLNTVSEIIQKYSFNIGSEYNCIQNKS